MSTEAQKSVLLADLINAHTECSAKLRYICGAPHEVYFSAEPPPFAAAYFGMLFGAP